MEVLYDSIEILQYGLAKTFTTQTGCSRRWVVGRGGTISRRPWGVVLRGCGYRGLIPEEELHTYNDDCNEQGQQQQQSKEKDRKFCYLAVFDTS